MLRELGVCVLLLVAVGAVLAGQIVVPADRIAKPPIIDGIINEPEWRGVPSVDGLVSAAFWTALCP